MMIDPTEDLELEPVKGLGYHYMARDLKTLAERGGAGELNAVAHGYRVEVNILSSDKFVVRCEWATGFAEMQIRVVVNSVNPDLRHAERTVSLYDSSERLKAQRRLPDIKLKTDGENPTAFIEGPYEDRRLTDPELVDALTQPVLDAYKHSKQ